jgi:hypothetical protein
MGYFVLLDVFSIASLREYDNGIYDGLSNVEFHP